MQKNRHLQEVQHIKTELVYVYFINVGSISRNYIAGLFWDIVIDAAQYLYTIHTANEFTTNDNLPKKRLYCRRSIVANIYMEPMDTPGKRLNQNSQ